MKVQLSRVADIDDRDDRVPARHFQMRRLAGSSREAVADGISGGAVPLTVAELCPAANSWFVA